MTFLVIMYVTEVNLYAGDGGPRCPEQVYAPGSVLETLAGDKHHSKLATRPFLIHCGLWLGGYLALRFSAPIREGRGHC